jgi:hypothetical protein
MVIQQGGNNGRVGVVIHVDTTKLGALSSP